MGEYDVRAVAAAAAPTVKGSAHGGPVGGRRGRRVVTIDAAVLSAAEDLPRHCARHGRPATRLRSFWITERFSLRQHVKEQLTRQFRASAPPVRVRDWPFCPRCTRRLYLGLLIAVGIGAVGFVTCTGTFLGGAIARYASGQYVNPVIAVPFFLGFALMLFAPIPAVWASPNTLARARVTEDGAAVRFTDPHPEFSRQMRARFGPAWPEPPPGPAHPGEGRGQLSRG